MQLYIESVGAREAAYAHRKLPYRFHYIPDSGFVNAFALPGGPVFIGAGLVSIMNTEDELAATLGHEIEHIDHYHCAERVQVQAALHRVPLGEMAALPVQVFVAGYSKTQELEADSEGTKLAVAAGYSPLGAIRLFEAFERLYPATNSAPRNPSEEVSNLAWKTLDGYFRSHPSNAERIRQLRNVIARDRLPASRPMTPLRVPGVSAKETVATTPAMQ
jgi:predicted Zn-dependent protease